MTSVTNQQPKSYSIESLRVKQRKAYDVILDNYRTWVDPLRMIIQGTAGTGKSYLIGAIKNALENSSHPRKIPFLRLAPIGVADFNISATTIHSTHHIPIKEIIFSSKKVPYENIVSKYLWIQVRLS